MNKGCAAAGVLLRVDMHSSVAVFPLEGASVLGGLTRSCRNTVYYMYYQGLEGPLMCRTQAARAM